MIFINDHKLTTNMQTIHENRNPNHDITIIWTLIVLIESIFRKKSIHNSMKTPHQQIVNACVFVSNKYILTEYMKYGAGNTQKLGCPTGFPDHTRPMHI